MKDDVLLFQWVTVSKIETALMLGRCWGLEMHSFFLIWKKFCKKSKKPVVGLGALAN
jgi:N6-adenosine-specific RNA methylase IME4